MTLAQLMAVFPTLVALALERGSVLVVRPLGILALSGIVSALPLLVTTYEQKQSATNAQHNHGTTRRTKTPALPESAPRFQPADAQFAEAGFDDWPGPLLAFISVSYRASACLTTSCKTRSTHTMQTGQKRHVHI